jgi:hypothetical protein
LMDIPAPGLDIGLQIGDAVDDGHGKSRSGLSVLSSLARARDPPNTRAGAVQQAAARLWHFGAQSGLRGDDL